MKSIRAVVGIGVIVLAIYIGWAMLPPYFEHYKLEDVIADEARMNTYTNKSEDQIRQTIYMKAKDLDIPLTPEQINVQRGGNSVTIEVNYSVRVDFPIHPVDLHFQASSQNKGY